jgi:hypothetical protein
MKAIDETDYPAPTLEAMSAIAHDRGLELSPDRIGRARDFLATFRHEVEQNRLIDLSFLPPYFEPETALQWIESGGRSQSSS